MSVPAVPDVQKLVGDLRFNGTPLSHQAADALEAVEQERARLRQALEHSPCTCLDHLCARCAALNPEEDNTHHT